MRSIMPLTLKVNSQLLVSMLVTFNIVDKCVVDQPVSTRGGVVAREVQSPLFRDGPVEILNALENDCTSALMSGVVSISAILVEISSSVSIDLFT